MILSEFMSSFFGGFQFQMLHVKIVYFVLSKS